MKEYFFSAKAISTDLGLFILRIFAGIAMLTHGFPKFEQILSGNFQFPDPVGIGSAASLFLVTFAEFICTMLIMVGLGTRLFLIPLVLNMAVAYFIVHADDPFEQSEKSFLFLIIFLALFFTGPGIIALDSRLQKKQSRY